VKLTYLDVHTWSEDSRKSSDWFSRFINYVGKSLLYENTFLWDVGLLSLRFWQSQSTFFENIAFLFHTSVTSRPIASPVTFFDVVVSCVNQQGVTNQRAKVKVLTFLYGQKHVHASYFLGKTTRLVFFLQRPA
jgi:hypothetical protein